MIYTPARHPDLNLHQDDVPVSFPIVIQHNGATVDLSRSVFHAYLTDDGLAVGELVVDTTAASTGVVGLTVTQTIYDAIKRYSTWRLRETGLFNSSLVEGRIVKVNA